MTNEEMMVTISPEMEQAGVECFYESGLADLGYLVRSVYMAMEYQRRHSLCVDVVEESK